MAFDDYLKQQQGGSAGGAFPGTGAIGANGLNYSQASAAFDVGQELSVVPVKVGGTVKSYLEVLNSYGSWSGDKLGEVQKKLVAAGFLRPSNNNPIIYGNDSPDSLQAYEQAVITAARQGRTVNDVLNEYATRRKGQGATAEGSTVRVSNPDDIRAAATQVAQNLIGQDPDPTWLEHFVSAFQSSERGAGAAANAGGTYTDAASPQGAAQAALKREKPKEVQRFAQEKNVDVFRGLVESTKDNAR